MTVIDLMIAGLATWRISYLLVYEKGPWQLSRKLREWAGIQHNEDGDPIAIPDSMPGAVFGCTWCMSVWVAMVVTVVMVPSLPMSVIQAVRLAAITMAVSAVAIVVGEVIDRIGGDRYG